MVGQKCYGVGSWGLMQGAVSPGLTVSLPLQMARPIQVKPADSESRGGSCHLSLFPLPVGLLAWELPVPARGTGLAWRGSLPWHRGLCIVVKHSPQAPEAQSV